MSDAIALVIVIGVVVFRTDNAVVDPGRPAAQVSVPDPTEDVGSSTTELKAQQVLDTWSAGTAASMSPAQLAVIREQHGYYASGSSDIDSMHPYELYDVETLRNGAIQNMRLIDSTAGIDPRRTLALSLLTADRRCRYGL